MGFVLWLMCHFLKRKKNTASDYHTEERFLYKLFNFLGPLSFGVTLFYLLVIRLLCNWYFRGFVTTYYFEFIVTAFMDVYFIGLNIQKPVWRFNKFTLNVGAIKTGYKVFRVMALMVGAYTSFVTFFFGQGEAGLISIFTVGVLNNYQVNDDVQDTRNAFLINGYNALDLGDFAPVEVSLDNRNAGFSCERDGLYVYQYYFPFFKKIVYYRDIHERLYGINERKSKKEYEPLVSCDNLVVFRSSSFSVDGKTDYNAPLCTHYRDKLNKANGSADYVDTTYITNIASALLPKHLEDVLFYYNDKNSYLYEYTIYFRTNITIDSTLRNTTVVAEQKFDLIYKF